MMISKVFQSKSISQSIYIEGIVNEGNFIKAMEFIQL